MGYDDAWAAGLFEGEGCFFLNRVRRYGRVYLYACASLKMTDEQLEFIKQRMKQRGRSDKEIEEAIKKMKRN